MNKLRRNQMEKQVSKTYSSRIILVMLAVILSGLLTGIVWSPANAATIGFYEQQITSDPADQVNPDIYGNTIVYQDNRNGNWDIYMNVIGYSEVRITTNTADQMYPKINGDKIVYQDNRNGNWDIYMYDLSTQTETQITNNPSSQVYPAIDGNRIVWQDNRNTNFASNSVAWDIYMYDLSTQSETRVTMSGVNTHPAISGTRIVYSKNQDVFCFDLSTGSEFGLAYFFTANEIAGFPAICDSHVVWHQTHGAANSWRDIHLKDVITDVTWDIFNDNNLWQLARKQDQLYPAISELQPGVYYIVYQDAVGGHIYLCSYSTYEKPIYQVTSSSGHQMYPKVSSGYIVYQDDRNGNWDIYMTMVGYGLGGTPQPPTPTGCTATVNENLLLHIPYLSYVNPILGNLALQADFVYDHNPSYPTLIPFKLLNSSVINSPSFSCTLSTLSEDFKIHIPDVLLPDGATHLWADLEYIAALSNNGNYYWVVTNSGVVNN